MRALVVDDSGAVRAYLRKILAALGFEVAEAGDGREALGSLRSYPAMSLVLLDWNMPGMNGIEVLSEMRADPTFGDVCVMMVTTETATEEITYALNSGANEYVMKPFTPDIIHQKLQALGFCPTSA